MSAGTKFDGGKVPMGLLDRTWLEGVAAVLGFGAKKYDAHNWRGGIAYSRLIDAALRHLHAFNDGENFDPESGLSHLTHASCCLMFLENLRVTRPDLDDRYLGEQQMALDLEAPFLDTNQWRPIGALVGDELLQGDPMQHCVVPIGAPKILCGEDIALILEETKRAIGEPFDARVASPPTSDE